MFEILLKQSENRNKEKLTPYQQITLGFMTLILIGAAILYLPLSYKGHTNPSIIDCIFTSTSAICVTGLVTLDTSTTWSFFGQAWILLLIQIGGIGFMTLISTVYSIIKKKVSLSDRLAVKESLNQENIGGVVSLVRKVVLTTLFIEIIGAILLAFKFIPLLGITTGIWYSIFHSVSAFCNAGFDLMGVISGPFTSLTFFKEDLYLNIVISSLIILGGLGFPVISELLKKKKLKKLSLHSKIVITVSASLILFGAIYIFITEYNNPQTLKNLPLGTKLLVSLFQSITTRTAGFNTIDLSMMKTSTLLALTILMFIGASPASIGGGVKTTTFLATITFLKSSICGSTEYNIFKKRIPNITVFKAVSTILISFMVSFIAITLITLLEPNLSLIQCIFESVSSLATVGLSLGATSYLSIPSKVLIIGMMFLGRVGSATVILAVSSKIFNSKQTNIKYTDENILI